jgi:hypothetical protein
MNQKIIKSRETKSFLGTKASPKAVKPTVFATKKQKGFVSVRAATVAAAKIAKPQVKPAAKVFKTAPVTMARPAPAPAVSAKLERQRATRLELMLKHGLR